MGLRQTYADFVALVASRANPHEVTAEQVGAYSKQQLDDRLANLLLQGQFDVTKYGDNSEGADLIWGVMYNSTTQDRKYFVVRTNGTGDPQTHDGCALVEAL